MRTKGEFIAAGLLAIVVCLVTLPAPAQQPTPPAQSHPDHAMPVFSDDAPLQTGLDALTPKQRRNIAASNFAKSKSDAAEMATLARELCAALNKPNAEALSPEILERADRIERLAKKIRQETSGF